jgi:hypothetical protein
MEIDITDLLANHAKDRICYASSIAEYGSCSVAKETFNNSCELAREEPPLRTVAELEALIDHLTRAGFSESPELRDRPLYELNALFIQLVMGDMREMGDPDPTPEGLSDPDLLEAQMEGRCPSNIYAGDDGRIYYYLGV